MPNKVINLGDKTNDSRMVTVEQMLKTVLGEVASGKVPSRKAVVILLDDGEDNYWFECFYAQISSPEVIALCRIVSCQLEAAVAGLLDL